MARTPLLETVQRAAAEAAAEDRSTTRRGFLRDAAVAGAATTAFGVFAQRSRAAVPAGRVVVVGAGLAGLSAAYRLKQAGIVAEVHEAADRIGGRCWTLRGAFADGQIVERGGELIDQGHTAIRQLASELGLKLDNLLSAEANGTEQTNWFDGARYSYEEATRTSRRPGRRSTRTSRRRAIRRSSTSTHSAAGSSTTCRSSTGSTRRSRAGSTRRSASCSTSRTTSSTGRSRREQSSLNLIYLLGYRGQGNLRIFGASNEKYHVAGGNDQITARLADRLAGQITTGSQLTAIRVTAGGRWELTFRQGLSTKTITADRVVLALPFSILRASVNFSRAGWERLKEVAVREQGMGTNSKLHVQFKSRPWRAQGYNGETFSDRGYQNSWEVTRAQSGASGILVNYTGGNVGASFGSGTPQSRAQQFLAQAEPVLPGITKAYNGRAAIDFWPGYEWTRGSYSYWKVGQYTKFAGMEGRRQGTCHFAGEHTSVDFQGYLNGAVETGQRAASEILADLK